MTRKKKFEIKESSAKKKKEKSKRIRVETNGLTGTDADGGSDHSPTNEEEELSFSSIVGGII